MPLRIWVGSTVASIALLGITYGAGTLQSAQAGQAPQAVQGGRGAQPGPAAQAQGGGRGEPATRPPLFFREVFRQVAPPGEPLDEINRRVTQAAVTNANLELKLYGADAKNVLVNGIVGEPLVPMHLWTGMATSPVVVTLRDKNNYADLTGNARIQWVTRTSGLHVVHPVVKLADGTLLVGDHADTTPREYLISEFSFAGMRWFKLDPMTIATTVAVDNPDLSKVDEVGFADLMPGGGHGTAGWINVGPWDLYAKPVKRR